MTREAARIGLTDAVQALQGAYATPLKVELPNQVELDPAEQTEPFLKVRIVYMDSWQASLGPAKHMRAMGNLVLECWVNQGKGIKPANDILSHFYPTLHMSDAIPGARTMSAKFTGNMPRQGWNVEAVIIPFWFDETS